MESLKSPTAMMLYSAITIVALIIIIFLLMKKSEYLVGDSLGHGGGYFGLTSGATQRFASQLTSTNQIPRQTLSNADLAEFNPTLTIGRPINVHGNEYMTSERGDPEFWEIGSQLEAYQQGQVAGMRAAAAAHANANAKAASQKKERFTGAAVTAKLEDDALAKLLY